MSRPHAVIVGFGPGIGAGAAQAFAGAGFNLSLISRNPEKHRRHLPAEIAARFYPTDAGDPDALSTAIQSAIGADGVPDVLVYNAVSSGIGKPSTIEPASLTRDFSTNVSGALAAARAVLPGMRARSSGTILFTGGGWALYPSADFASISIGKAALRSLTFMLAEELAGTGVRAATLTVMGVVQPDTPFDPGRIGRAFLDMYRQPTESFPVELQFKRDVTHPQAPGTM